MPAKKKRKSVKKSRPKSKKTTAGRSNKAFNFLKIREKPSKPRKNSVVEIRGSYYSPVTYTYLKDLFEVAGDYIDGFKFVAGCQRLYPAKEIRKIIALCKKHKIYVSTGGMIERVIVEGPKAVDQYLKETKNLGFNVVEVSSGLTPIPLEAKISIVKKIVKMGMKAKPVLSFMKGGAGMHILGYKSKLRTYEDVFKEAQAYIDTGAYKLVFESEGITEDLPFEKWRTDLIEKAIKKFNLETWMFEAADPKAFKWYLKKYGPDVNLFIDHSQVFEYVAWRNQLWGDPEIWEGKELKYP